MLLAVDIGNTNIVYGLFKGNKLISKHRILTLASADVKEAGKIDAAVISSVVPQITGAIAKRIQRRYGIKPVVLTWKNIRNLKFGSIKKEQVGVDRIVNAVAVKELYGTPAVIIDLGTATTFCALDGAGRYLGGAITSGLAISRDVLHERTAKLPLVEIKRPKKVIGKDTIEAMRSGLYWGYVEMIEGMIRRFRKELGGKAFVIATGGLSALIAKGTKMIDIVDPDLTLKGLNLIYIDARRARGAREKK